MLILEHLERRVQTMVLIAGMGRAAGADVEIPDWDKARGDFDMQLSAEPTPMSPEDADKLTLLQALGLR